MSVNSRISPSLFGLLGGLAAVLLSSWLTAETSRAESLRQERRSTYAEFLGSITTCENVGLILPFEMDRFETIPPEGATFSDARRELFEQVISCFTPLDSRYFQIRLITEDEEVVEAAQELSSATKDVLLADLKSDEERQRSFDRYFSASADFQVLARRDVTSPLIPSHVLQIIAFVLIEIVLGGLAFVIWSRSRELGNHP
jgi:hypothetical protein